ncbi:unnamed protein product [Linum tenue]|uniref:Uncharacterized protein n=1 Tax=Linum tenue TaxID=586396 RepID=A0AAV0RPP2_9ROSI|nr:unnamed protein product [Linum tenue]
MEEVDQQYRDIYGSGLGSESETQYSGKAGWVMDQGLTLGKKILVTGLVVTSAPVVIPSILVISALGFACSLPSSFFLATYLFTESLMTRLLPLQANHHVPPEEQHEGIEDSHDLDKYLKTSGEGTRGRTLEPIEDEDDEIVEENQNGYRDGEDMKGQRDDETVNMAVEMHAVSGIVVIEREGDVTTPVAAAVPIEVRTLVVEVSEGSDDVDENEELTKGTTGLLESIRDEGVSESPAEVNEKTTEAAASAEPEKQQQDGPESNAGGNANQNGSTEVWNNEKIWEQINALRVIVGYTASRQPTLMEELKALYVFTGVEPPVASFNDPYDLEEVNGRLRSLKLIVGVK